MTLRADPWTWRLYAVTDDVVSGGRSHVEVARGALEGGAPVVQLRDKKGTGRGVLAAARDIAALTRAAGAALIVNDRVDVALAVDADGVHVGQSDLPAPVVRRLIGGDRILGVSAGTLEEARRAEDEGADYVGFGPIFDARATKPDASDAVGLDRLAAVCEAVGVPVIAIGGIDRTSAAACLHAGAAGIAVVSAIAAEPEIAAATRDLLALLAR